MLGRMDGHALISDIAMFSCMVGDGGPRGYRRRGKPLPEKYLPGRFLSGMRPELRASIVRAVNGEAAPSPWFLRLVVDEEEPCVALPPPPVDRRWCRRGRWSSP
jgi:hypothetical protein